MKIVARPFVKWAGGKSRLVPKLLTMVPPQIDKYVEPFVGGGALFFALASAGRIKEAVLGDANTDLVRTWRAVRDAPLDIVAELKKFRHDKETYLNIRSLVSRTMTDTKCAARFIYLNKTGFNGMWRENASGAMNIPFGRQAQFHADSIADSLVNCSLLLKSLPVLLIADPWPITLVKSGSIGQRDLTYFDPPYAPASATAGFADYVAGGFGLKDHQSLASTMVQMDYIDKLALLTNSATEFTAPLYGDLPRVEAGTRSSLAGGIVGRDKMHEIIVMTNGLRRAVTPGNALL